MTHTKLTLQILVTNNISVVLLMRRLQYTQSHLASVSSFHTFLSSCLRHPHLGVQQIDSQGTPRFFSQFLRSSWTLWRKGHKCSTIVLSLVSLSAGEGSARQLLSGTWWDWLRVFLERYSSHLPKFQLRQGSYSDPGTNRSLHWNTQRYHRSLGLMDWMVEMAGTTVAQLLEHLTAAWSLEHFSRGYNRPRHPEQ